MDYIRFTPKLTLLFLLLGKLSIANAEGFSRCGEYLVSGVLRSKPEGLQIIVFEKTRSELDISLKILDEGRVAGFLDFPITVGLMLDEKFTGTKGKASSITQRAKFQVPDPLNPNRNNGFILVKPVECKSK